MSTGAKISPWRCRFCKRHNKGTAAFCGQCGRHWERCQDTEFVYYQSWEKDGQRQRSVSQKQWPATPRQRSHTPQSRHGDAQPKSTRRKKAKAKAKSQAAPQADPAWNRRTPQTGTSSSQNATSGAAQTAVDPKMKTLLAALKKNESTLPTDVQSLLQDVSTANAQADTKTMHAAVAKQGQARKKLQELKASRAQLHRSWSSYVAEAVDRWKKNLENFTAEDADLETQISEAWENVQTAKEHMETIKTAMEETESGGIDLTNESDEENMAEKTEPAATIKEGMQSMAMNLEALSKKAEEMVQESAPKRPRTADPGEHFAQPGK